MLDVATHGVELILCVWHDLAGARCVWQQVQSWQTMTTGVNVVRGPTEAGHQDTKGGGDGVEINIYLA